MARDDLGVRVERIATKAVKDGLPTTEGKFVGWANKTTQLGAYVDPSSAAAALIAVTEPFVMMMGGKHEVPISATKGHAPVGTAVDDLLFIATADNAITRNADAAGTNEVQKVVVKGKKGSFKLKFQGEETAAIKFNATALEVQEALEALGGIDPGDVVVTGGPGDEGGTTPYSVTFGGQFAEENVPAIAGVKSTLEEPGEVVVSTTTAGVAPPGSLPLGVVEEIDTVRAVALVNTNALAAFLGG